MEHGDRIDPRGHSSADERWLPTEAPALYAQDGKGFGATVFGHYFLASHHWLVTEFDPTEGLAFGWACLGGDRQNAELGYVSMAELASLRSPLRVQAGEQQLTIGCAGVERDSDWPEGLTITEGIALLDRRQGRG